MKECRAWPLGVGNKLIGEMFKGADTSIYTKKLRFFKLKI
jgi:hypothetical protein